MSELSERFEERLGEIRSYLQLLQGIEALVQSGIPKLGSDPESIVITPTQQRILYSGVYLQLYNLVESTITRCLGAVSKAATSEGRWSPGDLTAELRREWIRHVAKTHVEMAAEKRLQEAIALCDHLVAALPADPFDIQRGGGGNWDDCAIHKIAQRIGCPLKISRRASRGVKHVIRNDKGAMALVVSLRNSLAHGNLSFVECSQDDSVAKLTDLTDRVEAYLREVVAAFSSYIEEQGYLRPESRPAVDAPAR